MSWTQIIAAIKMGLVASAESVANIINGATKVGKAATVNGFSIYTNVTDLGLTTAATISQVWSALPLASEFIFSAYFMTDPSWNFPFTVGTVRVVKFASERGYAEFSTVTANIYRMGFSNGVLSGTWVSISDGGNADKVDGKHASDFLLLQNFIAGNMGSKCVYYPATVGKDCDDIEDFLALGNGADGLHYPTANAFYYIITLKYSETEKKQIALDYNGYKVYERHSRGGVWNDWKNVALASDFLPISGGTVVSTSDVPIVLNSTNPNMSHCILGFSNKGTALGFLGYQGPNDPVVYSVGLGTQRLLHTGNSTKVVVSTTAPTDTTAVWIVP